MSRTSLATELRAAIERRAALVRGAWKSGLLHGMRPAGIAALAKERLGGAIGPSSLIRIHAAANPDRQALVADSGRLSYRALDERIDRLAAGLRDRFGLGPGQAAIMMLHNRPEILIAQAAMARLGGAAVPVSWRSTAAELAYLAENSKARAVFVEGSLAHVAREACANLAGLPPANVFTVGADAPGLTPLADVYAPPGARVEGGREDAAVVIYTSGTTGKPKGAVRKFPKETASAVMSIVAELPIHEGDRHLAVCPMYHSTAFGFVGFTLIVGGTIVIAEKFEPEEFLRTVERERITTTAVVPTMLHRLLQLPDEVLARHDTSSLRGVMCGGAPLSGPLARRFIERFGPVLINFYGATETGVNTIATSDELLRAPGTIGHCVAGNDIRILDDDGQEVAPGTPGELWVKNDMLVSGYHADEESTKRSMREGYFSVGDLAHVDAHGLFHIDGRKRDMVLSGGVNVYPAEIEQALDHHPAVSEAAVIGVPDEEWGERVRAFVVLKRGERATQEDIVAYLRERLSGAKLPRDVVFLDELPKNPTGKVLKRELRSVLVAPSR